MARSGYAGETLNEALRAALAVRLSGWAFPIRVSASRASGWSSRHTCSKISVSPVGTVSAMVPASSSSSEVIAATITASTSSQARSDGDGSSVNLHGAQAGHALEHGAGRVAVSVNPGAPGLAGLRGDEPFGGRLPDHLAELRHGDALVAGEEEHQRHHEARGREIKPLMAARREVERQAVVDDESERVVPDLEDSIVLCCRPVWGVRRPRGVDALDLDEGRVYFNRKTASAADH
jgi:hypothetical protein